MKRALVVLLALVLGAGLLFAADAKWGAWIEGDVVLYDNAGNAYIGPNWVGDGVYNTISLSYSEDNFGFAMTNEFRADQWADDTIDFTAEEFTSVGLRDIKGWYKLFDGMLKVSAGKLRIGDYRPTSNVEGTAAYARILNAEWGLLLQVSPIKALSLGVAVNYASGVAAADYANALGFAASYDIEGIAKIFAQYSMNDDEVGAAVQVNAIEGLPLLVSFGYNVTTSAIKVLLSGSYSMDKLSFALDAQIVNAAAFDYGVEANVGYAVSDVYKVGATLSYASAGGAFFTDLGAGFGVYPWVNVTVGGGSLNLGFALWTGAPLAWKIPLKYVIAF